MIVLIDADSLVYSCAYGVETAEEAKDKFDQMLMFIINDIEQEYFDIEMVQVYHGSKNNFRYGIDPDYKANRSSSRPEYYYELSDYVKSHHNAISAVEEEVDDIIARHWRRYKWDGFMVCIVSIDKDYEQLPALIYNYNIRKRGFRDITKEQARRNFWTQMITGDAADNVNYLKGYGKKAAERILEGATSEFSHLRRVYTLFKEIEPENARQLFRNQYRLLKIGDL